MKNIHSNIKLYLSALAFILLVSSCYQDNDVFTPNPPLGIIDDFSNQLQSLEQTTDFLVQDGINIQTMANTFITIPSNAFSINGQPIENQIIEFRYLELKSRAELLLYNLPTHTSINILDAVGVYYFTASVNGQEVELLANKKILIEIPSSNPIEEMELFARQESEINTDKTSYLWYETDQDPFSTDNVSIGNWEYTTDNGTVEGSGYRFEIENMDWISCQNIIKATNEITTQVCMKMPIGYNNINTSVYALFKESKSVIALYYDEGLGQFCDPYNFIPVGSQIDFIALTAYGTDLLHFGTKDAIVIKNHKETIVMNPINIELILDILAMF